MANGHGYEEIILWLWNIILMKRWIEEMTVCWVLEMMTIWYDDILILLEMSEKVANWVVGGVGMAIWAKGHRTQRPTIQNVNSFNSTKYRYIQIQIQIHTQIQILMQTQIEIQKQIQIQIHTQTQKRETKTNTITGHQTKQPTFEAYQSGTKMLTNSRSVVYSYYSLNTIHLVLVVHKFDWMDRRLMGEKSVENSPVSISLLMVDTYKL